MINLLSRLVRPTLISYSTRPGLLSLSSQITQSFSRKLNFLCKNMHPATSNMIQFLQPITPMLTQTCGMKVKGKPRLRCKGCYFVWRQERLYVMCKLKPRHKQMSMKKKEKNTWILTDASQSKVRPW